MSLKVVVCEASLRVCDLHCDTALLWAGGASPLDTTLAFAGLSDFGADVVRLMQALGMIVDVSHAHDLAVERILQLVQKPVVASHSCVRRLCPIPRNLGDSLLEGIAASKGVIGVNFHPGFLDHAYLKRTEEKTRSASTNLDRLLLDAGADHSKHMGAWRNYAQEFRRLVRPERVPLERLLRQFDYIVNLVGEDAVAFGSDFDGIPDTPREIDDCRGFLRVCDALGRRGYSPETLEKIRFSNFVRVFAAVCDGPPG